MVTGVCDDELHCDHPQRQLKNLDYWSLTEETAGRSDQK